MTPYVRKGRKYFELRVPMRQGGEGPIRSTGTTDAVTAEAMHHLVHRLKRKPEYWPLLDALTQAKPKISLLELHHFDINNALDDLMASLDNPDLTDHLDNWERWVNSNLGATGTAKMYRAQVESLTGDGSKPFRRSDLTIAKVGDWLADRDASPGYKRKLLYALFSFIRYLTEIGVFEHNPIDKITRPKKGKSRVRWETIATDKRIVDASPKEYQALFALIKSTGAEVSPPLTMAVKEIILWRKNQNGYCGLVHIEGTKNETRDRHDALIESWARPYLQEHLKGKLPTARAWEGISRYQAHWQHTKACTATGVKGYTLRDARHSWAVRARKQGRSFEAIAEQLGNTVYQVSTVYAQFKMTLEERKQTAKKRPKSTRNATRKTVVGKPKLKVMGLSR